MKRFSKWLEDKAHSPMKVRLTEAIAAYQKVFGQGANPRGNVRQQNEGTLRELADAWQRALHLYKSEVVDRTYARLDSPAAQRALTVEWDRLLHNNARLSFANLATMISEVDSFSKQFRMKDRAFALWADTPMASPDGSAAGFIPVIGEGFSKSYQMEVPTCIPYSGDTVVEQASREEFQRGAPGSAWIGLLTIGARTGGGRNVAFLLPASHMEKHVTAPHDHVNRKVSEPVPQFASAGHQGGIVRLLVEGRMQLGSCNGCLPGPSPRPEPQSAAGYGCVMGFAMVKAYDAIGHQWAFTSMTCNVTATGSWQVDPATGLNRLIGNGGMQLPTDWAVAIWKATRDLTGLIVGAPSANAPLTTVGQVKPVTAAAAAAPPALRPPPPPPGQRRTKP